MIHPAGARGRFRHDEGRRRHELAAAARIHLHIARPGAAVTDVTMGLSLG